MDKISLDYFIFGVSSPTCCIDNLLAFDDKEFRTADEWRDFYKKELGDQEYLRIFGN